VREKTKSDKTALKRDQEVGRTEEENRDHKEQDKDSNQRHAQEESRPRTSQDLFLQPQLQKKFMMFTILLSPS